VIAENDFCKYAGIAYKKAALSFQGHPEYGHEFINGLVDTRGKGRCARKSLKKSEVGNEHALIAKNYRR
jgi:GMP synthase (glutamine-hydrolysing)